MIESTNVSAARFDVGAYGIRKGIRVTIETTECAPSTATRIQIMGESMRKKKRSKD